MLWRSLVPRRYGTPVSVRSPAFEGSVVLCQQDEFAEIVLSVDIEPREYTLAALTEAIVEFYRSPGR